MTKPTPARLTQARDKNMQLKQQRNITNDSRVIRLRAVVIAISTALYGIQAVTANAEGLGYDSVTQSVINTDVTNRLNSQAPKIDPVA